MVKIYAHHPTTKIVRPKKTPTKSHRRQFVHNLVREVSGFAPYERRMIELLKLGKFRNALRVGKKRLGKHSRAIKKRDELTRLMDH